MLEMPHKEVMFKSKHKLDFGFVSMDQRWVPLDKDTRKGQLISKCPFGIIVWTKYQRNYFWISVLNFFVASWVLPVSFLGFLGT